MKSIYSKLVVIGALLSLSLIISPSELIEACKIGDLAKVKNLLQDPSTDVNQSIYKGEVALHWACFHGHTDVVKELLKQVSIDVNKQEVAGNTPLFLAVKKKRFEIVDLLLQRNDIDLSKQLVNGDTLLHYLIKPNPNIASGEHKKFIFKILNKAHSNVNLKNSDGDSPLVFACLWQENDIAKALLEHGAEPIHPDLAIVNEKIKPLLERVIYLQRNGYVYKTYVECKKSLLGQSLLKACACCKNLQELKQLFENVTFTIQGKMLQLFNADIQRRLQ